MEMKRFSEIWFLNISASENVRSSVPGHSLIRSDVPKVLNLVKEEESG
jgi:hypothetical protein